MTHRTSIPLALALALAAAGHARAADPADVTENAKPSTTTISAGATATLIDDQLHAEAVRLLQLNENSLVIIDDSGQRTRVAIDGIVALLPADSLPDPKQGVGAVSPEGAARAIPIEELRARLAAATDGYLETIDGERFPGAPTPNAGATDEVAWTHSRFGKLSFDLDHMARVVKPDAVPLHLVLEDDPVRDVLHLANGDTLKGFIVSLADPIEIEADGKTIQLPPDRVAAAVFSNPRKHLHGIIVWLDDGTIAGVQRVSSDTGRDVQLTLPTGQDAIYQIEHLRAIGFDSGRLLALSDLEPTSQKPVGKRLLARKIRLVQHPDDLLTGSAATLDAFDVELPGPMTVEYKLPKGARRFAATASLADPESPWGDCELAVAVDGAERFRQRIDRDHPVAAVNVAIDGGRTLTITLDPGRYGPIKDRIILHRPLILLDQPLD